MVTGHPVQVGNTKIGKALKSSLSAIKNCPGSTAYCREHCFGTKRTFNFKSVKTYQGRMDQMAHKLPDVYFGLVYDKLTRTKKEVFRIHETGDFKTESYINEWYKIVSAFPNITFYTYTRSWRVPSLVAALKRLADLPNMFLNASEDPQTGDAPQWLNKKTRMFDTPDDVDTAVYVRCPEEIDNKIDCDTCGLCFNSHGKHIAFVTR